MVFVTRPISGAFIIVSVAILVSSILRLRPKVEVEEVT